MTSSPSVPLSKWDRQYALLHHPVLGNKVVRIDSGSLWIILLGPFYLLFKRLWLKAALYIPLTLALGVTGMLMDSSVPTTLALGINLYLLFKAGRWVEADMVASHGYQRIGVCNANSVEQALAILQPNTTEENQPPVQFKPYSIWQRIGLGFLVGIGVIVVLVVLGSLDAKPTELPTCESATAESMVKDAVKNGPLGQAYHMEVLAMKDAQTVRVDEKGVFCTATLFTNAGQQRASYMLQWMDKEKGQYFVTVNAGGL